MTRRPNCGTSGRRRSRAVSPACVATGAGTRRLRRWSGSVGAAQAQRQQRRQAARERVAWDVPPSSPATPRGRLEALSRKRGCLLRDDLRGRETSPTATAAEAVPGGDSRHASAHRHDVPAAARGHVRRCPCQSAATASAPNSPSATSRNDAPARVASSVCKVCSSSTAAVVGLERAAAAGVATVATANASSSDASVR